MPHAEQTRRSSPLLSIAIFSLAIAVALHAVLTAPPATQEKTRLDGQITIAHPNNIPVAAAPFDPQGGAIIRTARRGWYRVYPDHTVQYLGSDDDIGNR